MKIGIDASNIKVGGGVTHLVNLIETCECELNADDSILIWGDGKLLDRLSPLASQISYENVAALRRGRLATIVWRLFTFRRIASKSCDILFVPGGINTAGYQIPIVAMAQNMLPFEPKQTSKYGLSLMRFKMALVGFLQRRTFRRAHGVIFLTDFARKKISEKSLPKGIVSIIPHGVSPKFNFGMRTQLEIGSFNASRPFKLLYVSVVERYKNHILLMEVVAQLRASGYPIKLMLIGACSKDCERDFFSALHRIDKSRKFIEWLGKVPHDKMASAYQSADAFIFPSGCENLPLILLEASAAGLPIASNDYGAMREVLGENAVYFNVDNVESISAAVERLICDCELRKKIIYQSNISSEQYSWSACSKDTISFLRQVFRKASSR